MNTKQTLVQVSNNNSVADPSVEGLTSLTAGYFRPGIRRVVFLPGLNIRRACLFSIRPVRRRHADDDVSPRPGFASDMFTFTSYCHCYVISLL